MQLSLLGTIHGEEDATVKLYVPAEFRAVSCSSDEIELLVIRRASTLAVLFFVYISRQSVYLPAYYSTVLCTGAGLCTCGVCAACRRSSWFRRLGTKSGRSEVVQVESKLF